MAQSLTEKWQQALAGSQHAQAQWQCTTGGQWVWKNQGLYVAGDGTGQASCRWQSGDSSALKALQNFMIEVTLRGKAEAAGLSLGADKDFFIVDLDPASGARHLQLEIDNDAGYWVFRIDGRLVERDPATHNSDDLVNGQLSLETRGGREVLFEDLTIHIFQTSPQFSVFVPCYRFLQRLRISLRNWCEQRLPTGAYEILVGNPGSPDGTHEHLAAVASGYPHVRVREVAFSPSPRVNVSAMYNHMVDICHGEWIWITDADCIYSPACAPTVLAQIQGQDQFLFLGKRLFLTARQTNALLSGRIDGVTQFEALARSATAEPPPGKMPWAAPEYERIARHARRLMGDFPAGAATGLQIMHRSTLKRVHYRETYHAEDSVFIIDCRRHGISPKLLEGFFCLHMDHPHAWHTTEAFL